MRFRNVAYDRAYSASPRGRFCKQRCQARDRGIAWQLTFDQWLVVWGDKLPLRGRRKGQYVMARHNDEGAYAVGNVEIKLGTANASEFDHSKRHIPNKGQYDPDGGIRLTTPGRWSARLGAQYVGTFSTKEEAVFARRAAITARHAESA